MIKTEGLDHIDLIVREVGRAARFSHDVVIELG
jgi:hypothetical protein